MYTLKKGIPFEDLSGRNISYPDVSGEWKRAEWVFVSEYPWDDSGYCPDVRAAAAEYEGGITLMMFAQEETISGTVSEIGGPVSGDSCMEFFVCPFPDDDRYINCEINCIGTAHIGVGAGRHGRQVWKQLPDGVKVSASKHHMGWWAVSAYLPASFLKEVYGRELTPGAAMRGNFYKCDESIHLHFGAWNPVTAVQPDFHRPECFGEMQVEA